MGSSPSVVPCLQMCNARRKSWLFLKHCTKYSKPWRNHWMNRSPSPCPRSLRRPFPTHPQPPDENFGMHSLRGERGEKKNPEKRIVFVMGPTNPLVWDSLHHDDPGNIRYGISISLSKLGYFNASHCIVTCLKFKEQLSWMRPIVNLLLIIWSTVQQGN